MPDPSLGGKMPEPTENLGDTFLQAMLSIPCPSDRKTLRQHAREKLHAIHLPASHHEDWKYLDLTPVYSQRFTHETAHSPIPSAQTNAERLVPETAQSRLFLNNCHLAPHLSDTSSLQYLDKGTKILTLTEACHDAPRASEYLGIVASPDSSDFFANLNTTHFANSAILHVPKGQSVEMPLHVIFQSNGALSGHPPIFFPRILILLEPDAQAHLIEEYCGNGTYLTNSVVEIVLCEGAKFRHDRIQRESATAFHFCTIGAHIAASASYSSTSISLGAALSRQNPVVTFTGESAELELNGLCMVSSAQVNDTHSLIDHAKPDCTSRQLQKYIAGDSAHGIFNGQVIVRAGAQHTNAYQSSRNLLLSQKARIDTKPQLEILADDVKCSHGATVGQLDMNELFYLQSRGLDINSAKRLLLTGFAADVINRLALPGLKRQTLLNHESKWT
jgi:Fe-S cluster assembly protein SufD